MLQNDARGARGSPKAPSSFPTARVESRGKSPLGGRMESGVGAFLSRNHLRTGKSPCTGSRLWQLPAGAQEQAQPRLPCNRAQDSWAKIFLKPEFAKARNFLPMTARKSASSEFRMGPPVPAAGAICRQQVTPKLCPTCPQDGRAVPGSSAASYPLRVLSKTRAGSEWRPFQTDFSGAKQIGAHFCFEVWSEKNHISSYRDKKTTTRIG